MPCPQAVKFCGGGQKSPVPTVCACAKNLPFGGFVMDDNTAESALQQTAMYQYFFVDGVFCALPLTFLHVIVLCPSSPLYHRQLLN